MEIRQRRKAALDQRLNQREALGDFFESPANGVRHGVAPKKGVMVSSH